MALLLQSAVATGSGTSIGPLAFPNPTTQGTMLLTWVASLTSSGLTGWSATDTVNGSYTDLIANAAVNCGGLLGVFPNNAGGNISVSATTPSTGTNGIKLQICEFSLVNASSPLDQQNNFFAANGSTTLKTNTTPTTAQANELIIVGVVLPSGVNPTTLTAGGSYTIDPNSPMTPTTTGRTAVMYWYASNGPATYAGSGTFGASVADQGAIIATYKYSPATGSSTGAAQFASPGISGPF